jgi:tRNA (cytidine/uridine-2'-O-)-methyltransferase
MTSNTSTERCGPTPAFSGPTVVLHRPQIPQNTGNISRLCVAVRSPLVLTGKIGFDFSSSAVKRAGLDHWEHLDFRHFARFKEFCNFAAGRRIVAVTKAARVSALDFDFAADDILLFGNETMGLPPALLRHLPHQVQIPMWGPVRSLNLSNSVSVVTYAYIRCVFGGELAHSAEDFPRTYYRGFNEIR